MTYRSRWEELPIDILYQQILSLEDPSQILTFCYDPYINSKICQDKNGDIWKLLFRRDLSEFPILIVNETLMDRYLDAIQKSKNLRMEKLLLFAAENGYEKLLKEIRLSTLTFDWLSTALRLAANNGHLPIVKYLIEKGIDSPLNHENALKWAAQTGQLEIVKYLIEKNTDYHMYKDEALQAAAVNGYLETAKYLVENGANIHANHESALKWSARFGQLESVKYLIEKGADLHYDNEDALRRAVEDEHLDVAKYLIENGANVEVALNEIRKTKNKNDVKLLKQLYKEVKQQRNQSRQTKSKFRFF